MLQKVFPNTKIKGDGKLALNWEEPYTITTEFGREAYKLAEDTGKEVENPWNAIHLKPYKQ